MRGRAGRGGWFAAGAGFERALRALSDPTFKVFAYVCLRAERASGWLEFERSGLARELGKSRASLGRCLRELVEKGICELESAPNQHRGSRLRVRAEYWPYRGQEGDPSRPVLQPAKSSAGNVSAGVGERGGEVGAYVERVREMFGKPVCVQAGFGVADERLAADWQRAGVSLETVRRAILLGSVRKLTSMLDRPASEPVRSLRYFASLVEEVRQAPMSAGFWQHLENSLGRCEEYWRERSEQVAGRACSDLHQAAHLGGTELPSEVQQEGDKERG